MPVEVQKHISREDCKNNPLKTYVFGDNEWRKGMGGQAKAMRGEPNAIGVRTKAKPSQEPDSFWSDETLEENVMKVNADFIEIIFRLKQGRTVVFPEDGLGTGLSELQKRGPLTLLYIELMIEYCKAI